MKVPDDIARALPDVALTSRAMSGSHVGACTVRGAPVGPAHTVFKGRAWQHARAHFQRFIHGTLT